MTNDSSFGLDHHTSQNSAASWSCEGPASNMLLLLRFTTSTSLVRCLRHSWIYLSLILLVAIPQEINAWMTAGSGFHRNGMDSVFDKPLIETRRGAVVRLEAAAGGGGGFGMDVGAAKEVKLKPKQQWDRYSALKKETAVKVAVRLLNDDETTKNGDWLEVGCVKSCSATVSTELAVARQRALLAEHAKRLFPLLVSSKATIEWGYGKVDSENAVTWTVVDKSVLDQASTGIEKLMGFEGTPDPATGFYCVYNEGRLVKNTDGDIGLKPSSKKLG